MNYVIAGGYHSPTGSGRDEFFKIWLKNCWKYAKPKHVIAIGDSGSVFPAHEESCITIPLSGDVGHFMHLLNKQKFNKFDGWFSTLMTGAMLAYCNESDYVFKEQDCLAFGPWVERLYAECGNYKVAFGKLSFMHCAQSLILVKHDYIPEFVRIILESPAVDCIEQLGEVKFHRFMTANPTTWTQFNFGYDRDRPFNIKDEVFYIQQIKQHELEQLKTAGLI